MFYLKKLRRDLLLHPCDLTSQITTIVKGRMMSELVGQCLGKLGFVIAILDIKDEDIHAGLIDNDSGAVLMSVWYDAVLLRPFRNEVLDAIATESDEVI